QNARHTDGEPAVKVCPSLDRSLFVEREHVWPSGGRSHRVEIYGRNFGLVSARNDHMAAVAPDARPRRRGDTGGQGRANSGINRIAPAGKHLFPYDGRGTLPDDRSMQPAV